MDALPYTELDLLALNEKADALVPDVACCPILDPWLTVNAPLAGLISTSFAPAGFIVPVMLGLPQHQRFGKRRGRGRGAVKNFGDAVEPRGAFGLQPW